MKKLQIAIMVASLAVAMSASAQVVVEQGGLPFTQPSTDLSWADTETTSVKADMGGYSDPGGSFSIGGSGTYTVTGITVWDVVDKASQQAETTGLSLLNANGQQISTGYTATPATYGDGLDYNPGNPDYYPPATLYQVNFTVDVPVSAGSTYDFFLDGPYTYNSGLAADGLNPYAGPWLLTANYGGLDAIPWLFNVGATDGTTPYVGNWADYGVTGDAYVQVQVVPEPTTMALLLLPFGASLLRKLRKNRTA